MGLAFFFFINLLTTNNFIVTQFVVHRHAWHYFVILDSTETLKIDGHKYIVSTPKVHTQYIQGIY